MDATRASVSNVSNRTFDTFRCVIDPGATARAMFLKQSYQRGDHTSVQRNKIYRM